jgi:hypothetical protein
MTMHGAYRAAATARGEGVGGAVLGAVLGLRWGGLRRRVRRRRDFHSSLAVTGGRRRAFAAYDAVLGGLAAMWGDRHARPSPLVQGRSQFWRVLGRRRDERAGGRVERRRGLD